MEDWRRLVTESENMQVYCEILGFSMQEQARYKDLMEIPNLYVSIGYLQESLLLFF